MVKCFNDKKCHGYHEHCDPHLPHCGGDCACCTVEPFCGERDILSSCPVPVCPCNPCWDNCRCTKEIKKLQTKTDEIENKTENFDGRVTKVEKDIVDFNRNLTQQIGDLAEKEQNDVDNLQEQIDALDGQLDSEIERATTAENNLDAKINKEINDRIADVNEEEARAKGTEQTINGKVDAEIANRKADAVADAEYNSTEKVIYFKNKNGQPITSIDARDFVKDGMVDSVVWNNRQLIITWNTDSGKTQTIIPGDQIFNPDNYYTKAEVNRFINAANDRIDSTNVDLEAVRGGLNILTETVHNTANAGEIIEFGTTETIATVNNVPITVGIPNLPTTVSNVQVNENGELIVTTTDGQVHRYQLPSGYINRLARVEDIVDGHTTQINNLDNRVSNNTTNISKNATDISQLKTTVAGHTSSINDLINRVAALEALWYNNNGVITAVGGKPVLTTGTSTAGGFYDSLISG